MSESNYYIIGRKDPSYLLVEPKRPSDQESWMSGVPFNSEVITPVTIFVKESTADGQPEDFYSFPLVVSDRFYQALLAAGVDNIHAYDAVLDVDGNIFHHGYKALNVIGMLRMAGEGTTFTGESRLIDAGIDGLVVDPNLNTTLLMFRMAEVCTKIVVHKSVKNYLENLNLFPNLEFIETGNFFTIG